MSDLRFDPVSNRWIAIARNRQDRPMELVPLEQTRQQLICPFCKGNEEETPAPFAAYRKDGSQLGVDDRPSSWTVRVIPNKYPSFPTNQASGSTAQATCSNQTHGPFTSACLPGRQELIVTSPRHITSISELTEQELTISFLAYQDRIRSHQSQEQVKHSMLFMNCRSSAGASLSHIHTQLIGSPVISSHLAGRHQRNIEHFQNHGVSLIAAIVDWERQQKKRLVFESDDFCVFCPFASRFPFQIWLVPKHHSNRFVDCPEEMRNELAGLCQQLVARMENLLEEPGYNLLLHQAPFSLMENDHWYFELFPRLTRAAGFEWGTDIWVNPVAPESAAKRIRVE